MSTITADVLADRLNGLILGTSLGDSLGLPYEGLSRQRLQAWKKPGLGQTFVLGRGMISDDTDHAYFVARALTNHDDVEGFSRSLAWDLRLWFLTLPAGIGLATARAIFKLWLGFSPAHSGVFSAGNGPAMRSPLIGACFFDDPHRRHAFVTASTRLTHTDPKADTGAQAIAEVAAWILRDNLEHRPSPKDFLAILHQVTPTDAAWTDILKSLESALARAVPVAEFAEALGLSRGVSGYIYHTVPVVLYAWFHHFGDVNGTLEAVISCGGDADTTGAIAGALAGLTVGQARLPQAHLEALAEFPRTVAVLREAGTALAEKRANGRTERTCRYFWPALPVRNLVMLVIVLIHGLRRLFPPY